MGKQMHISIVFKTSVHFRLAPQNIFFFLNQGNLPKSTLSTLSMQQATKHLNMFRKHIQFYTQKKTNFSQHEYGRTTQKLTDVHLRVQRPTQVKKKTTKQ